MTNSEQVELLTQGTQAWNAWRAKHTESTVDLSDGALRGLDLRRADLSGADLRRADLNGADLRGIEFFQCPQLESARNWQSAYRDEDLACGAAIPSR